MSCQLCGHIFSEKHRLLPGNLGGEYAEWNVADLCPNHHAAVHFLMSWLGSGKSNSEIDAMGKVNGDRLSAYIADRALWEYWVDEVKPICERVLETQRLILREFVALSPERQRIVVQAKEGKKRVTLDDIRRLATDGHL